MDSAVIRAKFKKGATGGKKGRPFKKEHWRVREKRLKEEAAAAHLAQTSKLRGTASNDMDVDHPPRGRKTGSSTQRVTTRTRRTRSQSRHHPQRINTDRQDQYIAGPATPTRTYPATSWLGTRLKISALKNINKKLTASNKQYKRLTRKQQKQISALNKKLLLVDLPEDRPPHPDEYPSFINESH